MLLVTDYHLFGEKTKNNDTMSRNHRLGKLRWIGRVLLGLLITLAVVYLSFGVFVWWAMHQPPEVFGGVMARVPEPIVFMLYPFVTLWIKARGGPLKIGDRAPDFSLEEVNKGGPIQLSGLN